MVDLPVWNARTKHIVGGHQRLSVLDTLEKGKGYRLFVLRIDVDEKTEKALNVALNNPNAQADYDLEKLGILLKEIEPEKALFDRSDIMHLFGTDIFEQQDPEAFAKLNDQVRDARERYKAIQAGKADKHDDWNYYCVLVFNNQKDREAFAKRLGMEDNKWLNGEAVARKIFKNNEDELLPIKED